MGHLSQSVPMFSPLTWKLTGDIESNQITVSQNAADSESPLDCSPECPQEEYVYEYQYAGSAGHDNNIEDDVVVVDDAVERAVVPVVPVVPLQPVPVPDYPEDTNYISDYEDYEEYNTVNDYTEYTDEAYDYDVESASGGYVDGDVGADVGGEGRGGGGGGGQCPGGDLQTCVDVCPGQFGARVFGLCVATCGRRCP